MATALYLCPHNEWTRLTITPVPDSSIVQDLPSLSTRAYGASLLTPSFQSGVASTTLYVTLVDKVGRLTVPVRLRLTPRGRLTAPASLTLAPDALLSVGRRVRTFSSSRTSKCTRGWDIRNSCAIRQGRLRSAQSQITFDISLINHSSPPTPIPCAYGLQHRHLQCPEALAVARASPRAKGLYTQAAIAAIRLSLRSRLPSRLRLVHTGCYRSPHGSRCARASSPTPMACTHRRLQRPLALAALAPPTVPQKKCS
jgi:hypothetical protein